MQPSSESAATASHEIKLLSDAGKGRAVAVLFESGEYRGFAEHLFAALSNKTRTLLIETPVISAANWRGVSAALRARLEELRIRQFSPVAFGGSGAIAQAIAIDDLRIIRTMVLVDAATRPHPTRRDRTLDRLERFFPLGLPMRSRTPGFDGKPYLQRMRCPVLLVSSSRRTPFLESQAEIMAEGMPTSWLVKLGEGEQADELARMVLEFQDVPAKCPQGR
jgi:hypothetical protein